MSRKTTFILPFEKFHFCMKLLESFRLLLLQILDVLLEGYDSGIHGAQFVRLWRSSSDNQRKSRHRVSRWATWWSIYFPVEFKSGPECRLIYRWEVITVHIFSFFSSIQWN